MSSRFGGALLVVLVLSIDVSRVRSQVGGTAGPPGAGSAASDPASANPDDDESGSGVGSGSALVAPADPNARLGWLRERFGEAITTRPQLARAAITFHVVELASGRELVSREPDRTLGLASNAKLLT